MCTCVCVCHLGHCVYMSVCVCEIKITKAWNIIIASVHMCMCVCFKASYTTHVHVLYLICPHSFLKCSVQYNMYRNITRVLCLGGCGHNQSRDIDGCG